MIHLLIAVLAVAWLFVSFSDDLPQTSNTMKPEETYYEDQVSEAKARRKALPEDLRTMTPRTQAMHDTFAPEFSPEYMTKLLQDCEGELAKATAALKAIFDCTDPYADGVIDASAHDKLCNEISSLARPWARTHSENKNENG